MSPFDGVVLLGAVPPPPVPGNQGFTKQPRHLLTPVGVSPLSGTLAAGATRPASSLARRSAAFASVSVACSLAGALRPTLRGLSSVELSPVSPCMTLAA